MVFVVIFIIANIIVIILCNKLVTCYVMRCVVVEYHTKFPAYERVVLRERKSLIFYL